MYLSIISISLLTIVLAGCSTKNNIKLTSVKIDEYGDWIVSGKTNASDGSIIVGVNTGDPDLHNDELVSSSADELGEKPAVVTNGKFKARIDASDSLMSTNKKTSIYLAAVNDDFLKKDEIGLPISSKKKINSIKKAGSIHKLSSSKKQIAYWQKISEEAAEESDDTSTENEDLPILTSKVKSNLKNGVSDLRNTKVTVEGPSIKPYTAGIAIYDKDFMDLDLERNSMIDVLNAIQSLDGYDKYENFNVAYYADLRNDKGKIVKRTKILSFGIKGSELKQLSPSNMSADDIENNVNSYWEQSNIK